MFAPFFLYPPASYIFFHIFKAKKNDAMPGRHSIAKNGSKKLRGLHTHGLTTIYSFIHLALWSF